jgi:hypothetical protein
MNVPFKFVLVCENVCTYTFITLTEKYIKFEDNLIECLHIIFHKKQFKKINIDTFVVSTDIDIILKPTNFYHAGTARFPKYELFQKLPEEVFQILINTWNDFAINYWSSADSYCLEDLRKNYKKYRNESIIQDIIE